MTCINCKHDLAECTCDDAPERIKSMLSCSMIHLGPEYRERLVQHASNVLRRQVNEPITRSE